MDGVWRGEGVGGCLEDLGRAEGGVGWVGGRALLLVRSEV